MRLDEIRIGEVYALAIPERLPPERYPSHVAAAADWFALRWAGWTNRYQPPTLTIIQTHDVQIPDLDEAEQPGYELVAGILCETQARPVDVELTAQQAAELELPPGRCWRVTGFVADENGRHARFPTATEQIVPARWIRPHGWTPYGSPALSTVPAGHPG